MWCEFMKTSGALFLALTTLACASYWRASPAASGRVWEQDLFHCQSVADVRSALAYPAADLASSISRDSYGNQIQDDCLIALGWEKTRKGKKQQRRPASDQCGFPPYSREC